MAIKALWALSLGSALAALIALSVLVVGSLGGSSGPGAGDRAAVQQVAPPVRPAPTETRALPTPLPPRSVLDLRFSLEVTRSPRFAWPAVGPITNYFGRGHPTGIDIGLDHEAVSPVRASADGVVKFAGGDPCCGYGLYVEIEHEDGAVTLYGHLASISVSDGDQVLQGEVIGLGGSTGVSDGKHLHFELRINGVAVDPLRYLPVQKESPYVSFQQAADCPSDSVRIDPASRVRLAYQAFSGASYQLMGVEVRPAQAGAPAVTARIDGARAAVLQVAAPLVTGLTYRYVVEAELRLGDSVGTLTCWLELTTLQTLPNPERAIVAEEELPGPTPVAPTRTPTPRPAPTATKTPAPAGTPPTRPTVERIEREPPAPRTR